MISDMSICGREFEFGGVGIRQCSVADNEGERTWLISGSLSENPRNAGN